MVGHKSECPRDRPRDIKISPEISDSTRRKIFSSCWTHISRLYTRSSNFKMPHLTPQQRARIAVMAASGKSDAEIRLEVQCSQNTVRRWKNDFESNRPFSDQPRSGRPRKITPELSRRIVRKTQGQVRRSLRLVARELKESEEADISYSSVRRALRSEGLHPYRRPRKPRLSPDDKRDRRRWLRHTNNSLWSHVVFSDEKIVWLVRAPNRKNDIIWSSDPAFVPPAETVRFSKRLHIWAAISSRGKTELAFIEGTLNATKYVEILDEFLLPTMQELYRDEEWSFMQDHAPSHSAKLTQDWLKENVPHFFTRDDWPAHSPDLNPIETLWANLDQAVQREDLNTIEKFKAALEAAWGEVTQDDLERLIGTMAQRRSELRKSKGGHTSF